MNLHTHADLQAVPPARIWQVLRSTRHAPPGRAARGARAATYNAALEQAQQLLTAAAAVSIAARPLPLFYGLSQFARAVAATATELPNDGFKLSGHGVKALDLQGAPARGISSIRVRGEATGAFPTIARALRASPMDSEQQLGAVWPWIPDSARIPLPGASTTYPPLSLMAWPDRYQNVEEPWLIIDILGVPATAFTRLDDTYHELDMDAATDQHRALIAEANAYLARYPRLHGWKRRAPEIPRLDYSKNGDGTSVDIRAKLPLDQAGIQSLRGRSNVYHGQHLVYPSPDGGELPVHPFLAWWQALYTLSMLARYQPDEWIQLTDIASHPDAAAIEYILSEALIALPEIGLHALEDASGTDLRRGE